MILALNEDGSMPGEPLPFIEAITWFFIAPVGIFLIVWLLVVAAQNVKSKKNRVKQVVLTRINE